MSSHLFHHPLLLPKIRLQLHDPSPIKILNTGHASSLCMFLPFLIRPLLTAFHFQPISKQAPSSNINSASFSLAPASSVHPLQFPHTLPGESCWIHMHSRRLSSNHPSSLAASPQNAQMWVVCFVLSKVQRYRVKCRDVDSYCSEDEEFEKRVRWSLHEDGKLPIVTDGLEDYSAKLKEDSLADRLTVSDLVPR